MAHRRRRRIRSDSDSDQSVGNTQSQSQSSSIPLRRSSRLRRNSQSSFDDDEDIDLSNNHNRNNNDSDNDSDVIFDENKNEIEESDNESSENEEKIEITHPDPAIYLPHCVEQGGEKWDDLEQNIEGEGGVLERLIDAAQALAEHNHETNEYQQNTQRLQSVMNKLLNLNKQIKIEKLMHKRLSDNILNGSLSIDDDAKNENGNNPIQSGDWLGYFDIARKELFDQIEHGNRLKDDESQIKELCKRKQETYNLQFDAATKIDEIEEFDDDNHNRNGQDEDSEDDDIIIDRNPKDINVGSIKCALTQGVMRHPVKSQVCGHTFEKEAVENYIMGQSQKSEIAECPLPGCTNLLTLDQMIRDVKMERMIKAQSKQQNEGSDDDDAMMDLTVPV